MMKRIKTMAVTGFLVFLAVAGLFAQARPGAGQGVQARPGANQGDEQGVAEIRKEIKSLALTDGELDSLEKVTLKDESEVAKSQAELKVLQARLERLMLEKVPPMEDIKALLRQSLEWEYKIRLIRLERNIAVRGILGEDRWARVYRLSKAWVLAKRAGKIPENQDLKTSRALKLLEALQ